MCESLLVDDDDDDDSGGDYDLIDDGPMVVLMIDSLVMIRIVKMFTVVTAVFSKMMTVVGW